MNSYTSSNFWRSYDRLPPEIQKQADEKYEIWQDNPYHKSLHFKCVKPEKGIWSVRINRNYRALGVRDGEDMIWYWIGDHDDYMKLLK